MLRMGKSVSMVTNHYPLKKKKKKNLSREANSVAATDHPKHKHQSSSIWRSSWLRLWPLSSPSSQSKGCMFSDHVLLCAAPAVSCTVVQQHQMLCYYVPKPQSYVVTGSEEESEPSRFYSRT